MRVAKVMKMSADEEKNAVTIADEGDYIYDKEQDEQIKKDVEQIAEIIKDPQKAKRIRKIIELELSGEVRIFTRRNLMAGLTANMGEDVAKLILQSIEKPSEFLDKFAIYDLSEDVLTFLKDLNLLYNRKAVLSYNYNVRREDWVSSNFEIATSEKDDFKITMELIKGSGEIVRIIGEPHSFVSLIGIISDALSDLDLADIITEEGLNDFEKDIYALIDALKRTSSADRE